MTFRNFSFHSLLMLLIVLSGCGMLQKKTQRALTQAEQKAPYDVIIVPGVPHDGRSWQTTMQIRMLWTEFLYRNGITKNVIFSGAAVYTPYCEARIMASYGEAMGIPEAAIYLDTNAEHSTENVYYSYREAKKQGFAKIALATDPFQASSMRKFIRKHELPVDLIPIVFDTISILNHQEPRINPEESRVVNFTALPAREGFFRRLRGTFGKHIVWYKSDLKSQHLIRKYARKGRLIDDTRSSEH